MDDALFDDPVVINPMYGPTSPVDSPVSMDLEEYDSTMTDMLMSVCMQALQKRNR